MPKIKVDICVSDVLPDNLKTTYVNILKESDTTYCQKLPIKVSEKERKSLAPLKTEHNTEKFSEFDQMVPSPKMSLRYRTKTQILEKFNIETIQIKQKENSL